MLLPNWMCEAQPYKPSTDRDQFLRINTLKLTMLLARIKTQRGGLHNGIIPCLPDRILSRVDVGVRLGGIVVLILCMALASNLFFVYCMLAIVLVMLAFKPAEDLISILKPALGAGIFTALIMVPALFIGQPSSLIRLSLKVFLSVCLLTNLTHQSPWNKLVAGLRLYHVPHIVVFIFDLTIKYIVLLGEVAAGVLDALSLRSVGHNRHKSRSAAQVLGVTFLKAHDFGEELYDAMECRGFMGDYCVPKHSIKSLSTLLYLLVIAAAVIFCIYLEMAK